MSSAGVAVVLFALLAGCSGKDDSPPPSPMMPDAAMVVPAPGVTELPVSDPTAGMHLDAREREAPPPSKARNRNARMIGIMLRSSPNGAIAAVDGMPIGPTPTYWEGEVTGGQREFTFALANHAVARYRFVPITSGVVYGRLEPIESRPGAGVPAIPRPAQSVTPVGPGTVPGAGVIQVNPQGTTVTPSAPVTQPDPDEGREPGTPATGPGSEAAPVPTSPTTNPTTPAANPTTPAPAATTPAPAAPAPAAPAPAAPNPAQ